MRIGGRFAGAAALTLATLWCAALAGAWLVPGVAIWLALFVAVSALLVLALLVYAVIFPLVDLTRRASSLAAGEWAALVAPCSGVAEVEALRRALNAMADHVRRAQTTGQAFAAAITEGQEAERTRLAHDLHDATIQSLIAVAQRLERAGRLVDTDAERARSIVAEARQEIVADVAGLRDIIADLRPPALDELGLVPALELMIEGLPPFPAVRLEVEGPVRRLAPDRELAVLRMVQEALSNVRRHAGATTATVQLRFEPEALRLQVVDDGRGLPSEQTPQRLAGGSHWGLIGLQERAARFDGSVELSSTPGKGTRLEIRLPEHDTAQPDEAVVDPVCKATILPATAYGSIDHAGATYFFCCPVCQGAFQRDPSKYLPPAR